MANSRAVNNILNFLLFAIPLTPLLAFFFLAPPDGLGAGSSFFPGNVFVQYSHERKPNKHPVSGSSRRTVEGNRHIQVDLCSKKSILVAGADTKIHC